MTEAATPGGNLADRLRELESQMAERDRLFADLEVHREEVRQQNERLCELSRVLEESRDRYADLYDFAPTAYLTLDEVGVVRELNLAAASLLGLPRGQLVGLPLLPRLAAQSRQGFLEHMRRCRDDARECTAELEVVRPDGRSVAVEMFTRRVSRAAGVEYLSAMHDLTERNRAEREREVLVVERERERAASEAKGRFLATLSHELRTPLTPILATVSSLERQEGLAADLQRSLAMIRRNVELEARLIDDLLDLTRIEHGKLRLDRQPLDLHDLLERLLEDARGLPTAGAVDLDMVLDAAERHVDGDRTRLQQVFWNLLTNALKFTPAGGRVTVRSGNGPAGALRVTVEDTGAGIVPERIPTLFQPFKQLGETRPGVQYGGLGLGLAITRGLVEAHGGTVEASSAGPGQGASFVVTLPAVAPPPRRRQTTAERRRVRAAAAISTLLLVEDHPDTAEALAALLAFEGLRVTVAGSVAEAVAKFDPAEHELLISDLALPDGTGLELIGLLHAGAPRLPAIALSGFGTDEDVRASLEAGFREHVTKPVDLDALMGAVKRLAKG